MKEHINPAQRVLNILKLANTKHEKAICSQVLSEVLGVNQDNKYELLQSLADFISLVELARDEIRKLEEVNSDLYIQPFNQIQKALVEINLIGNWASFKKNLDPKTMTALEFCADILRQNWTETIVDPKAIESLLKEIQDLISEVNTVDIKIELKAVILDNLLEIQHAILSYNFFGAKGLDEAYKGALGSVLVEYDSIKSISEGNEEGNRFIKKFFSGLDKLNMLVSTAKAMKAIASPLIKLFSGHEDA